MNRLSFYLEEANVHINRLEDVLERLKPLYPLSKEKFLNLSSSELDILDTLAFRFSKLQDLIGAKIFREYLKNVGFIVEDKSFFEILREIEKEGIVDIDLWNEFRKVRNLIAHDYPGNVDEKVEAINYLIEKTPELIEVVRRIEDKINKL